MALAAPARPRAAAVGRRRAGLAPPRHGHAARDELARRFALQGVATLVNSALPRTEACSAEVLSQPIGPTLDDSQVDAVVAAVRAATVELASGSFAA